MLAFPVSGSVWIVTVSFNSFSFIQLHYHSIFYFIIYLLPLHSTICYFKCSDTHFVCYSLYLTLLNFFSTIASVILFISEQIARIFRSPSRKNSFITVWFTVGNTAEIISLFMLVYLLAFSGLSHILVICQVVLYYRLLTEWVYRLSCQCFLVQEGLCWKLRVGENEFLLSGSAVK